MLDFTSKQISRDIEELGSSRQSANYYDPDSMNFIHKHNNGLVLDYGSGVRNRYFDHVINYEIHPNNSVDVIGDGVELPFKDNTFDAILSHAVFEHVRYPFESAKELIRVLKPQGSLYISVPFLFHEHGYPNHFYNMTQSGLLNLFGDSILVKKIEVFRDGYPICFLTAYLDHYVKGLPCLLYTSPSPRD